MKGSIKWICTTLLAGLSYTAFCQDDEWMVNPYLTSAEINKQYKDCFGKGRKFEDCDAAAIHLSYIGLTDSAIATRDRTIIVKQEPDPKLEAITHNTAPLNAVLTKNVAGKRIIIIEVLPYYSPSTVFITSTLKTFRNGGYKYLACDGIYNTEALNNKKHPTTENGPAVIDPQYNNLVRTAIDMGFTLVNYDCADCKDNTEKKIESIAGVLGKDSAAKVLIITRDYAPDVAAKIQKQTSVAPFLINQSAAVKRSQAIFETPLYQKLGSQLKEPSVVYESGTSVYSGQPSFNYTVFFPEIKYVNGRADFLQNSYLLKQNVSFPGKMKFPILVKVFAKSEYENEPKKVAVDAIEVLSPQESIDVFAPLKGEYIVSFTGVDKVERVMPVVFK